MTAETLKPFLNLPNATAGDLKAHCAQKSAVKRGLLALGCILAATLCCALIGVQIWHLNKTAALQREVDDLKQQLYLRAREFNEYEFDNELFDGHDEYVYEPDLDPDMVEDGHRRETEMSESGLSSSGMHEEDEDIEGSEEVGEEEEEQEERENLGLEELKETNEDVEDGEEDDGILIDDTVDMSVSASAASGKRRARSISGVTRQGVPIIDEPYVPRRNRTRHPHRIFEQLRQRPEELVTPPTSGEMFRWDVENRKTHTASHSQQSYGSISIRPYQHEMHQLREHHSTTTPMPVSYGSHSGVRHHSRNELNAGNPTKPPAQILNRMSRVQATGENMRKQLQQHQQQRFPKVVGNPGTQKEIVMAPESRVRLRQRKAGAVQGGAEPVAKGLHLVKQSPNGVSHRNVRHRDWTAKDNVSKQALLSQTTFAFDGEQLTINEPGLYYLYAQVTYDNEHGNNGYKVMVGGKKHLSCTVHVQGQNTNACFTAGLTEIETAGTTVAIEDFDHGRHHVMYPEKTFFGVYKVGRLPPHTGPNGRLRQARKVLP
ncbi:AGAP006771-PA [Anopheles gambiae str. PEST]|uniref:AGAP006771-PA n=1 Tax=Anopheles gambiae TaxID=7165 RepID=Q7QIB9_ANOGA|nr:AGAP006771-PA [Anopheles gambiae str. PEST]